MGLLAGGARVLFDLLNVRGRRTGERVARRIEMAARRAVVATVVATTVLAVAGEHAPAPDGRRHKPTARDKTLTQEETPTLPNERADNPHPDGRPGPARRALRR